MTGLTMNRRALLALAGVAALVVTGCSSSSESEDQGAIVFSYTDARGKTVELDHLPETVVAQSSVAAALWDNGVKVKGIYGELTDPDDYQNGDIDLAGMTQLGSTFGEFNIEKFTAMKPDLTVDMTFDRKTLWYAGEVEDKITKVAPGVGMALVGLTVKQQIEAFVELSEKLGGDLDAAGVQQAKLDFEAAGPRVVAATKVKDLTVAVISVSDGKLYYADATQHPDLAHLEELGVSFPTVTPGPGDGPFEVVSLEQANKYPADVILVDARSQAELDRIKDNPAWQALPAVQAGQVYSWHPLAPFSYKAYAQLFNDLAAQLEIASKQ